MLNGSKKAFVFLSALFILSLSVANAQNNGKDKNIPRPKPKPWNNNVDDEFSKTIKNLGLEKLLSNISDPRIKQAVVDAAKGKCPNSSKVQGAADVQHKKQCEPKGRPPKVPNGKDGKKCIVPNLKGGSVEGMCIQGCCVYIKSSAKGASEKYVGSSGAQRYGNSAQGFGNSQNTNGLLKSFMGLLKGFGSGSGGSDSGNYGDYYNPKDLNLNDNINYDNLDLNNFDYGNDNYKLEDNTNVETISDTKTKDSGAARQTNSESITSDSVDSIIYGSDAAKDQEYTGDERYGFVKRNKGRVKADTGSNSNSSKEEIIEIEKKSLKDVEFSSKGTSQENKEPEYTVTGFDKSIKVSNTETLSFWERLKLFFLSIFR